MNENRTGGEVVLFDAQQDIIDYLMSSSTHGGASVERIDTHSAVVFLAGERALKLKRAVRYDYLDFSTPELRHAACEAEFRLNHRTAPTIYTGVLAVTREPDGSLAIDGRGQPVDWLVQMVRFNQDQLLDRLASAQQLEVNVMGPLAHAVARLHTSAERRPDHGGRAGMQWVVDGNASGFAEQGAGILDPGSCTELTRLASAEIDRVADRLEQRRLNGFVRQCHGDLHLRNIVLLDGQPTLFDAIEFNDDISCIDVWYDLGFLLMDLWRRGLHAHTNAVLNRYLAETHDDEGLELLPLFLSCRAAVRAKTSATASRLQSDRGKAQELEDLARSYLTLALEFLHPAPACLLAIGGFSGSGKSTLARAVASGVGRPPGAVIIRSDEIRKQLLGVSALTRLDASGYTQAVNEEVYRVLRTRAAGILQHGQSVIADAVFARPEDRFAIETVAGSASISFVGLWLDATREILVKRVETRGPDASDADATIVARQLASDPGPIAWRRLQADGDVTRLAAKALSQVAPQLA